MLAAIRTLNRLECVGETLRAALNGVASIAPEWLRERAAPEWFDRYSTRIEESRLPKGKEARTLYAERIGADGSQLLSALYDPSAPVLLWKLPAVQTLRQTWVFQYYSEEGQLLGRYQEALAAFEQTLRLDPMYLRAYTNEGNMLHQLGRPRLIERILLEQGVALLAPDHLIQPTFGMRWDEGIILCSGQSDT